MFTKKIKIGYPEIITPYGQGMQLNFQSILDDKLAYKEFPKSLYGEDFPVESAGLLSQNIFAGYSHWTKSEVLLHLLLTHFIKCSGAAVKIDACILLYKNLNCFDSIPVKLLTDQESVQEIFKHNNVKVDLENIHIIDNTCTTGLTLLTYAAQGIETGIWNNVFVCAIDLIDPFVVYLLNGLGALGKESRPFDKSRAGFVKTESASCALVTADSEILKEHHLMNLLSFHQSNDAFRLTDGRDDCLFISTTMKCALESSGLRESELAFIKAHGTGTQLNDQHEAAGILKSFQSKNIPVTSLKGHLGHTTDASGLVENLLAGFALKNKTILKTAGCEKTDFELNLVRKSQRSTSNYFLSNSFGFGGNNASAVFEVR